jgi:hypothetical protein
MQLMQRHPRPPSVGQRIHLAVGRQDGVEVRHAAEQGQGRQVGLAVAAVGRRVHQPRVPVQPPQDVARPQVAVRAGRRLAYVVPVDGLDDLFHGSDVGRCECTAIGRSAQVRQ